MKAKTKLQFLMLNDMVLVRRHDAKDEATSDIERNLMDIANTQSNKATVVGVCANETEIAVGDVVIFSEHAANDIELDGEKYLLLNRRQVYMVI